MVRVALVCALLIALAGFALQDQIKNSPPEVPSPADTDSQLTQELRLLEQQLGEAAMAHGHKSFGAPCWGRVCPSPGRRSRTKRTARPVDGKFAA